MTNESTLVASVGFRHVIEDGLTVLSNRHLNPERRKFVIEDLMSLLRQAAKGSDLANKSLLFVKSEERSAFEAFSLLNRYLEHGYDPGWRDKLPAAEEAFTQLKNNADVSPDVRAAATTLLSELLTRIKRQGGMGIPGQPEDIRIFE